MGNAVDKEGIPAYGELGSHGGANDVDELVEYLRVLTAIVNLKAFKRGKPINIVNR